MKKLTILHFNDVYELPPRKAEPVGGAARFMSLVRQHAADKPLILFSGDCVNPSMLSTMTKGKQMAEVLNTIGVHAACLGNHDLDFGLENFVAVKEQCIFPWLLSNVADKETGEPLGGCLQSLLLEWEGVKVGLLGLVEPEYLETLPTIDPEDLIYTDFVEEGRRLALELQAQGADVVIALTHCRVPNDKVLAAEVPEIDLILGGHDHDYSVHRTLPHGTPLIKSGTDFRDLSRVTLTLSPLGPLAQQAGQGAGADVSIGQGAAATVAATAAGADFPAADPAVACGPQGREHQGEEGRVQGQEGGERGHGKEERRERELQELAAARWFAAHRLQGAGTLRRKTFVHGGTQALEGVVSKLQGLLNKAAKGVSGLGKELGEDLGELLKAPGRHVSTSLSTPSPSTSSRRGAGVSRREAPVVAAIAGGGPAEGAGAAAGAQAAGSAGGSPADTEPEVDAGADPASGPEVNSEAEAKRILSAPPSPGETGEVDSAGGLKCERVSGSGRAVVGCESVRLTVTSSVPEDPEVAAIVERYEELMGASMGEVVGYTAVDLDGRFSSVRNMETNLGNFVCGVLRAACFCDVVLLNSGTLRSDAIHPAGKLTNKDLISMLPMMDDTIVIEVTGAQLLAALENGVSQYPALEGRFPQVSGVEFAFDPSKPPMRRVVPGSVLVGKEPLSPEAKYSLGTKAFLAEGRDGYDTLAGSPVLLDSECATMLPTAIRMHLTVLGVLNKWVSVPTWKLAADKLLRPVRSGQHLREEEMAVAESKVAHLNPITGLYEICPRVEGRIRCIGG